MGMGLLRVHLLGVLLFLGGYHTIKQIQYKMSYQQYLNYQQHQNYQMHINPLSSVLPMNESDIYGQYAYPMGMNMNMNMGNGMTPFNGDGVVKSTSPGSAFVSGWHAGYDLGMEKGVDVPLGTSLSEIYDLEKKGTCPPMRKKRRVSELEDGEDISKVKLSREQLLKVTSEEFEEFVNRLNFGRELSKTEEKEIKRQRRLIKNREYAQEARKKKKQYVNEMEGRVNELTDENDQLKARVEELEMEVGMLRNKISEYEKIHDTSSTTSEDSDYGSVDTTSPENYSFQVYPDNNMELGLDQGWSFSGFQNGVFLMVFLFSFAIFFNPDTFGFGMGSQFPIMDGSSQNDLVPNSMPVSDGTWKGPKQLLSSGKNSVTFQSNCMRYMTSPAVIQKTFSVEDIYQDEAKSPVQCTLKDYRIPQSICIQ
eukprot:TRINITY_DN1314_c0_g1_i1.p1 TRINITY_DN1314_c0_g1~~TRINITY_DN1314_c0_g1_i1.p1  ORF type:complete len:423 (-),score=103.62 TRINITY_DN1314_c0_g1_i1:105-1373(-)